MKKKIAALLIATMIGSMLAGCGGGSSSSSSSSAPAAEASAEADAPVEKADPRFKYEEPVTLTSYFKISPAIMATFKEEDLTNSVYYERQREETNIDINWLWKAADTADDAQQKQSIAIASGDIPDFMLVNASQLALLAKSDLINRDIGKVFEQYASDELMEWTTAEGPAALESATDKGEVIAIPLVDSAIDAADVLWIRRDWVNKLGLEMPTTLDELYDLMIAFRDQDPDGNGQNDTLGMVFHQNFLSPALGDALGLFNGFGAYPTAWIEDGEGGLKYGAITDENKEALDYIAKMYAEGLIEQDFSSNDDVKASEAAAAGRAGIQYGLMWNCNWPLNATVQNDPEADWVAVPIPGKDGAARPQIALRVLNYVVVSKKCEHPEAVIRLLNFWVDKYAYSGEEYNDYLVEDENGVLNFPLHTVMLKTWFPLKNLMIHEHIARVLNGEEDESTFNAEELISYNDIKKYLDGDIVGGYGGQKTFGIDMSAYDVIQYYYDNDMFEWNKFTTGTTKTMGQKMSTVTDKVNEYYTKVIMGIESTDNFDNFVKEVNALGLDQITEEVNEWYKGKQ